MCSVFEILLTGGNFPVVYHYIFGVWQVLLLLLSTYRDCSQSCCCCCCCLGTQLFHWERSTFHVPRSTFNIHLVAQGANCCCHCAYFMS